MYQSSCQQMPGSNLTSDVSVTLQVLAVRILYRITTSDNSLTSPRKKNRSKW